MCISKIRRHYFLFLVSVFLILSFSTLIFFLEPFFVKNIVGIYLTKEFTVLKISAKSINGLNTNKYYYKIESKNKDTIKGDFECSLDNTYDVNSDDFQTYIEYIYFLLKY